MTHVLVLVENQPYPYDPRLRAQVEALVGAGYRLTVAGPTGYGFDATDEAIDGVSVIRYRPPPGGRGPLGYVREFGVSLVRLSRLARRVGREDPVDAVFVCNPPDLLVLLALPAARRGAAVIFDDRELSPELFEAKFGRRGPIYRLLVAMERYAFRHADAVIVTNASYVTNVTDRGGVPRHRVFVVGNGPDGRRIHPVPPQPELRQGRRHLVLWLGAMSDQEGLDHLVEAADRMVHGLGRTDVTFALVGPGDVREALEADVRRRGLAGTVLLPGRVDDSMVRAYIATADVCVATDQPNRMNDRAAMRKVLEYMAMGRAVVQFPLEEMSRLCGDTTLYARPGDADDFAARICELLDDPERRRRLGEAARRRVVDGGLMWSDQIPPLLEAVATSLEAAGRRSRRAPVDG